MIMKKKKLLFERNRFVFPWWPNEAIWFCPEGLICLSIIKNEILFSSHKRPCHFTKLQNLSFFILKPLDKAFYKL